MKIKFGYIARFGKDGAKVHSSYNPDYTAWGEIFKVHAKFLMVYFFWLRVA